MEHTRIELRPDLTKNQPLNRYASGPITDSFATAANVAGCWGLFPPHVWLPFIIVCVCNSGCEAEQHVQMDPTPKLLDSCTI